MEFTGKLRRPIAMRAKPIGLPSIGGEPATPVMAIDTSADDVRVRFRNRVPSRRGKSRVADSQPPLAFAAIVAVFPRAGCASASSADRSRNSRNDSAFSSFVVWLKNGGGL